MSKRGRHSALILLSVALSAAAAWGQDFTRHVMSIEVPAAFAVTTADFDGDGDLDAAATGSLSGVVMWVESRGTTWVSRPIFLQASTGLRGLAAGDFDSDGDADIALAAYGNDELVLLENTGNPTGSRFADRVLRANSRGVFSVNTGDLDGDGDDDLVVTEYRGNTVRIFRQTGGQLHDAAAVAVALPLDAVFADVDRDGDLDVLGCSDAVNVFWIERSESGGLESWTLRMLPFGRRGTGIDGADLDGDQDLDLAIAAAGDNRILFGEQRADTFAVHLLPDVFVFPRDVRIADFDRDNIPDVVASAQDGGLRWWRGMGNRVFSGRLVDGNTSLYGITVVDFDQDGDLDVLAAAGAMSELILYRNQLVTPAYLMGTVRAAATQAPLPGITVRVAETGTGAVTDAGGFYRIATAEGTFRLRTVHPCWNAAEAADVIAVAAETTLTNFALRAPRLQLPVTSINLAIGNSREIEVDLPLVNSGDGLMTVQAAAYGNHDNDDWLFVTPDELNIPAGETIALRVRIAPDTSDNSNWDYIGRIELRTNACPDTLRWVAVIAYVLDADESPAVPRTSRLRTVYPNPFNAATNVEFELAAAAPAGLRIFDLTGRLVSAANWGVYPAGRHRAAVPLEYIASGTYLLVLDLGGANFPQRIVLLK